MNAIRHNSHSLNGRPGGFTLVEVLLSIGILGVGMAMVAAIFPVAAKEAQESNNLVLGTVMCDNLLGSINGILSGGQRDFGTVTAANSITPWTDPVSGTSYTTTNLTFNSNTWSPTATPPTPAAQTDQWLGCYLEVYGLPWSPTATYVSGNTVVYNNTTYVAQPNAGTNLNKQPDQNTSFWTAAVVESGKIVASTATTASVVGTFSPMPGAGSLYRIVQPRSLADSGIANGNDQTMGYTTVKDGSKLWSANQWTGWTCFFPDGVLYNGAGATMYLDSGLLIPLQTRAKIGSVYPPIAHTNEPNTIALNVSTTLKGRGVYQLVLLADENNYNARCEQLDVKTWRYWGVINPLTLRYPCGLPSGQEANSATNGTSRGCVLMTTKQFANDPPDATTGIYRQPANMSSSNGATIVVVAYNKSARANLAGWGPVLVQNIQNAPVNGSQVPVVTISSGTLCAGSPLVFVETGAVAKILQVPAIDINGKPMPNTAVLDTLLPLPRGTSPAQALVVQEFQPLNAGQTTAPYTGAVLPASPAMAWKVTQCGSK